MADINKKPPLPPFINPQGKPPLSKNQPLQKPMPSPLSSPITPPPRLSLSPLLPASGLTKPSDSSDIEKLKNENEKLLNKISELEKSIQEEREKIIALTLKSQEEQIMTSKLESSVREAEERIKRTEELKRLERERDELKAKV
ncbi:MAG: hypothetical protein ACP5PA_06230, partial [Elusimicrobiales bacterium]